MNSVTFCACRCSFCHRELVLSDRLFCLQFVCTGVCAAVRGVTEGHGLQRRTYLQPAERHLACGTYIQTFRSSRSRSDCGSFSPYPLSYRVLKNNNNKNPNMLPVPTSAVENKQMLKNIKAVHAHTPPTTKRRGVFLLLLFCFFLFACLFWPRAIMSYQPHICERSLKKDG